MTSVALAHDVLAARAGGERVLVALAKAFGDAPITTLLHEPAATFDAIRDRHINTTWLDRSAWLRRNYRHAVPIAALTYAATTIDADVTICSSSGLSHHVRTTGRKVVYCHTPARWLHDADNYLQGYSTTVRTAAKLANPLFARIDRHAMRSADIVVANSTHIADEISGVYGLNAQVIHPCSTLDIEGPVQALRDIEPGFVLTPSRPLGYKRLDVLIEAARRMPAQTFLHIGDGPHRDDLAAAATPNVHFVRAASDAELRWAYRNARVVALTCAEDFGLVPLEAAAHGVHTVAPEARGLLDHHDDMLSTYRFADVDGLCHQLELAPDASRVVDAGRLDQARFTAEIRAVVRSLS